MAKVGLALSGGGFRAAFFHVGVLARLADLGRLREVEVISTVSGGSIVGAAYYLRLRRLLESTPDAEVTDEHYREVVREVETRLRTAVRRDIRARVFANLLKNLAMASPHYSRSDRIGDLYDRYLYKPLWARPRPERGWRRETQIELRELLIAPPGEDAGFKPEQRNAPRAAKVPVLVINATSLNSGHNWRFEAVRMGEPVAATPELQRIVDDVDRNARYPQAYFGERPGEPRVPPAQQDFPVALAVAASACVPGLFQPLAISGMYPSRVQLVDGGVHDNQGVQGLLDAGCTELIVSDASGQMDDAAHPSTTIVGVVGRSMSVATDRVREVQLVDVEERSAGNRLMHLRKPPPPGVAPSVQDALSRIRTDLDFFSDDEARALALDGYLMTGRELAGEASGAPATWGFAAASELVAAPSSHQLRRLRAGRSRLRRPATLVPAVLGLAVLVAAVVFLGGRRWPAWTLLVPLALVAGYVARLRFVDLVYSSVVPILLAPFLFVAAWLSLLVGALRRG